MKKGISLMVATAILIAFTVGVAGIISNWIEENYPIKDEKWSCVEWRNETKIEICYEDYSIVECGTNKTLPVNIEIPKKVCIVETAWCSNEFGDEYPCRCEFETKQTCIKEGFNCRNESIEQIFGFIECSFTDIDIEKECEPIIKDNLKYISCLNYEAEKLPRTKVLITSNPVEAYDIWTYWSILAKKYNITNCPYRGVGTFKQNETKTVCEKERDAK